MSTPTSNQPITAAEAITLSGLLDLREQRSPDAAAYRQFEVDKNRWRSWTWREVHREVSRWRQALAGEQLHPGDRVAILLANSVEWVCFEQAALGLGLVVVPLYTWDSPENLAYLLTDSGSRLLFTGSWEQWRPLAPHIPESAPLNRVLLLKDSDQVTAPVSGPTFTSIVPWLKQSEAHDLPRPRVCPDDLATLVYTSGTTGPPKGVMLSHHNILSNAEAILEVINCTAEDTLLSFLPLSHAFERTVGYFTPMMAGCSVAYSRSIDHLAEDLQTVRPTILISVPRIYEKVYAKVQRQLENASFVPRALFALALRIGWRHFEITQGRASASMVGEKLLHPLLHRLVAKKILDRLGGRIRLAVSGGAPLLESVSRFFLSLGLPLIQGYGLTEFSPVVSTNIPASNLPASVGKPLPGISCRLGTANELLVKGPGLMLGYWQQPERTREAIDAEGWLHTGDQAVMEEGRIHLRGRIKEIIVTSTGEKVAPADLELLLVADPLVDHAMVVGEGRPYLVALLVLNLEGWQKLARKNGLDPQAPASLDAGRLHEQVLARIQGKLHTFPAHAQIRRVALLLDEWSVANGSLTPTMKLKRTVIEHRYGETIDALYEGHEIPASRMNQPWE
jgi:long-chain acyl-CoA synthetase